MESTINTYNLLPPGFRPAKIADFHFQGIVRIGLKFLVKQLENEIYEEYTVRSTLTAKDIKPFIDAGRCWVKE